MASLSLPADDARAPLRQPRGWLLLVIVAAAHVLGANEVLTDRFGWGSAKDGVSRIEVAFVRELAPTAPPPAAGPSTAAVAAARVPAVASAPASNREAAPAAPPAAPAEPARPDPDPPPAALAAPPPEPAPPLAPPMPTAAAPVEPAASAVRAAAAEPPAMAPPVQPASAASATTAPVAAMPAVGVPNFDWPPSTRLSYQLRGNYRGPVEGSAQVDWLRTGTRYQVHLETAIGPLMSRRSSSDGELTDRGLSPQRFEREQKVLFSAPRRFNLRFGPDRIGLPDGTDTPTLPGVQDEASQFVQLTWLFTTQPHLMQVGRSIEMPLIINRRVDRWIYDVREVQQLDLPFGSVETYYVKPRREAKGGEMTAEIWFAPTLQYLPVRILIRQDESTFVDLQLKKPPLQATR